MSLPSSSAPPRLAAIDGLRALAMTMVIAMHCDLAPFGWTGVWLFYEISGYVITRGFIDGAYVDATFGRGYGGFMWRRLTRIVPAYLLYIAVASLGLLFYRHAAQWGDLPYLLTFTYNWHLIEPFWPGSSHWAAFGHLWTLSVEQQFYLAFPFLMLLLGRQVRLRVMVGAVLLWPLVRLAWVQAFIPDADYGRTMFQSGLMFGGREFGVYLSSICQADAFLLGALIAHLEPEIRKRAWLSNLLWACAGAALLAYLAVYLAINAQSGSSGLALWSNLVGTNAHGEGREVFAYVVVDLLAAALLVHALLGRAGAGALARRGIAWVGRVSYGGYLYHGLVLIASHAVLRRLRPVDDGWGMRIGLFLAVWLLTVGVASASFRWFEAPLARWLNARKTKRIGVRGDAPVGQLG